MKKIELTRELIEDYLVKGKVHAAYKTTCEIFNRLRVHSDGESPGELLTDRRPSESVEAKNYRVKIYCEITKSVISQIITSLGKIRKSQDWSIVYPKNSYPNIPKEEVLEEYAEKNIPVFVSLENLVFSFLLKPYLTDPNAVVLLVPEEIEIEDNEFYKPFPLLFFSNQVLEYKDGALFIGRGSDKIDKTKEGRELRRKVYYCANYEFIECWQESDDKKGVELVWQWRHNSAIPVFFRLKGIVKGIIDNQFYYESIIDPIVPFLKEAVREYSDLQLEVVQHIHSTPWFYQSQDCADCNSTGRVIVDGEQVICSKCKGQGRAPISPFDRIVIQPPMAGEPAPPIPPAGYITKQIDIVKIQDERIDKHIYRALASINLQFLADIPQNVSGLSKEVDRDELNSFVHSVAEDLAWILTNIYRITVEMRYNHVVPSYFERQKMVPLITIPKKFDLLSSSYLSEEMARCRSAGMSNSILAEIEKEYVVKRYQDDNKIKQLLIAAIELDPLYGVSEENKVFRLQNGGVSIVDYVLSCRIKDILLTVDESFFLKPTNRQREIVRQKAMEIIDSEKPSFSIVQSALLGATE